MKGLSVKADAIIVGDHSVFFRAQNGLEVELFWEGSPGGVWICGGRREPFLVFGEQDLVEIFGGGFTVFDPMRLQLGHESSREASVESFSAPSGLGAVSEDDSDLEQGQGSLEVGILKLGPLSDM